MLTETHIWPEPPPRHARLSERKVLRRRRTIDVLAMVAVVAVATGAAYLLGPFQPGAEVAASSAVVGGGEAAAGGSGAQGSGAGAGGSAPGDSGARTDPQDPAGTDELAGNVPGTGASAPGSPGAFTGDAGSDAATGEMGVAPTATADDGTSTPAPDATAGTCPEADQVWSAENGHLDSSELAAIPFAPEHSVRADVVDGLVALNDAYAAQFGANMIINSAYRSYEEQEALYDPSSDTAAPPGCSNHGTGLAIDIGGGVESFGSAEYDWLKANAEGHGWVHPPFAEPDGRNPEPWHWQSVQAPNSY
ncbi:M15 family metallopeptidase [Promicromonospora sp. Populi]|uniref:M15 family metallopeptidase n=1 Tax=Promicromonospora sp. Populi TaxID=3239420 RepID=UPI0034E1EE52